MTFLYRIISILFFLGMIMPASAAVSVEELAEGNTAFAFDLYAQVRENPGNLFLSPYSISTALAMTYAGARENTAAQMAQVLHFSTEQDAFHTTFGQLQQQIGASVQDSELALAIANALWVEQTYRFLETFLATVQENYVAEIKTADFQQAAETARLAINTWVEEKTQKKIKDLIPAGTLSDLTRLVLVNAIYFKGLWKYPFEKEDTQTVPFWLTATTQVDVPMMHQQDTRFNYMENDTVQVLELPYENEEFSMVVLLPKARDGLEALEKSINSENYRDWLAQLRRQKVDVFLPRFKMTREFELSKTLAAMGMPDAFNTQADFSSMDGSQNLSISKLLHKAFVEVNEAGTEAAAATAVVVELTGVFEPTIFRADHPFLFAIRHRASGSVLFLGRVSNPADTPAESTATATLSPELALHIPLLNYQAANGDTLKLWANLKPVLTEKSDRLLFEVVDYGVVNGQ